MPQRFVTILLHSLVFFILFSTTLYGGEQTKTVKIAILPCTDVVKSFERFKPMIDHIEADTGLTVQTVFPKNEKELIQLFRKRKVDFLLISPYGFANYKDSVDSKSLLKALGPDGNDYEVGYVIARKDSGFKTVGELKDKTVLFGMECSASRWVFARDIFNEHNIDIDKDLGGYSDGGCCEDISYNIFLKAADAGLVCQHYFDEQKKTGAEHFEPLVIIGTSHPSPTRIFAAHKDTPKEIINRVTQSLMAIDMNNPNHESLITNIEIGGFVKASPDDYTNINGS